MLKYKETTLSKHYQFICLLFSNLRKFNSQLTHLKSNMNYLYYFLSPELIDTITNAQSFFA